MSRRRHEPQGARMRKLRAVRGLTQKQLADQTGYSPGYIGQLERQTTKLPVDAREIIALALDDWDLSLEGA